MLSTLSEVVEFFNRTNGKVSDITPLNSEVLFLTFDPSRAQGHYNLSGHVVISSMVTALARKAMHELQTKLDKMPNIRLYFVEADALGFSKPKKDPMPMDMGHSLGCFREEYE